jgi:molybdopterin-guanine dinucleotide biosynthesis protein A
MQQPNNKLNGLVLAGGKSIRMGHDKGSIKWHGKEQKYYVADLLIPFCSDVFISCRQEQQVNTDPAYKTITDIYTEAGPLVGILSAFNYDNEFAWLVLACDLPLMDKPTIEFLIQKRNSNTIATAYKSPYDGLPEPLIAIWEPQSTPLLHHAYSEKRFCPRKLLLQHNPTLINPPNPDALINTNTPQDIEKVQQLMNKKNK